MQHGEFAPPEELSDTIKCFWYDQKDYGAAETAFEVVPDGYAEIIFHFGSGCSIVNSSGLQPLPSPFMIGLLDRPVIFSAKNNLEIIAVRCYPWTVFDLLGLQPGKDSVRMFEHPVAQLQPVLQECVNMGRAADAITIVQQYLLDARSHVAVNSMLHKAGIAMQKAKGSITVSRVAAAAHATVRTLERKFKQSSGHTVKDVSGLIRFEQVRNRLWTEPDVNLAGIAQELGYTDQSHLSRAFKRYSGITPAAFARNAKKNRQAAGNDFVAFVQA